MAKDSYLVGLIGSGIGPSLSPALHEREADRQGLRYVYRLIDIDDLGVGPEAVGDLVRAARDLGFDGLNITHPCKQLVIEHLDGLAPQAAALGAVNTVVFEDGRAVGHNTDVTGFAASFARGLPDAPLENVVQLGAGGAGAAVAHATLTLGAEHVTVVDALPDRAADLAASLDRHFGAGRADAAAPDALPALLGAADGVVHATPTGMAAHPGLPFAAELLRPGLWVAEVVYRPLETELLRAARGLGCATLDGGGMAVFQAADAFRLFTGREPDASRMLADIGELAGAAGARN
ncbi:shikimate dehydrogenase [Streptomyces caniscabiei]|uniref:Shikimate dehydrogenase (NADP(+)) n=2 Tax=Streptomyces caniscabiei TaxID=2746961 RepID=A0ABU4MNA2_9ACTN|nr:shikimate dehydrogenase [Streptomyces caniscabiei]MBE4738655.1 shikimate dehydrogenase [Streptomyces caniscabiei]MBE4756548.1 shikimate dehydrogenase [Streptomyces caniscabiei]MBE4768947.1 shikimate dehydrogenase [Streptomyces caniscabiei]MBE4782919.1 shikimate dehydrogenase [Streptomyces caniscabiei]MBE4792222.1 shikimate dehydrogenase [Streptomyces caniscabiei]